MKRIMKIALASLVCVFSLISIVGCSCSKVVKVMYTVNVNNVDEAEVKKASLAMKAVVEKKFRESADTPCYEKITTLYTFDDGYNEITYGSNKKISVENNSFTIKNTTYTINNERNALSYGKDQSIEVKDRKFTLVSYELMVSSTGVSKCYNSIGEEFEKATVDKVEKIELEKKYPLLKNNDVTHYESSLIEAPKEENYSLIYEFTIENCSFEDTLYIKELDVDAIIKNQLKEDSALKVTYNVEYHELVVLDTDRYYQLMPTETSVRNQTSNKLIIRVQVKGLSSRDLSKGVKKLNLDINLQTKFN